MAVLISCATLPWLSSMVQMATDDLSGFVWNFFLQWHTYRLSFFTLWWIIWSAYPSLGLEYGNELENGICVCNHCHIANFSLVLIYVDSNVEEDLDDMIVLTEPWSEGFSLRFMVLKSDDVHVHILCVSSFYSLASWASIHTLFILHTEKIVRLGCTKNHHSLNLWVLFIVKDWRLIEVWKVEHVMCSREVASLLL